MRLAQQHVTAAQLCHAGSQTGIRSASASSSISQHICFPASGCSDSFVFRPAPYCSPAPCREPDRHRESAREAAAREQKHLSSSVC